jgi:rubrerythrin
MEDLKLAKQLAKALERAIVREREAQAFYMNQATNAYEFDVKKLFKNLVHEEIGHERMLTAKKQAVLKEIARLEKIKK